MPWNIKDSVSNLLPEGQYRFRVEDVTFAMTKGQNGKDPFPQMTWKCTVVGGENDGKMQFVRFPMRSDLLGILGAGLASTQAFAEDEDLPDDPQALTNIVHERIGGHVFEVDYKHRADKSSARVYPDVTITGPSTAGFA